MTKCFHWLEHQPSTKPAAAFTKPTHRKCNFLSFGKSFFNFIKLSCTAQGHTIYAFKFQPNFKRTCSELSCVDHMDEVQYLLRCHGRYMTRLLQLSLSTSSVDQQRGDENAVSSPPAHAGSKIEARKQFRTFTFAQNRAPFSWDSFTLWPTLRGFLSNADVHTQYCWSSQRTDICGAIQIQIGSEKHNRSNFADQISAP